MADSKTDIIREDYLKRHREASARDHAKHIDARRKKKREYQQAHREKMLETSIAWNKENYSKVKCASRKHQAKIRAIKRKSIVLLNKLEKQFIDGIYRDCSRLNEIFGMQVFEIDHTIPMTKGGLHSPNNLQIVPKSWNRSKHNSHSNRWEVPYGG